MKYDTVCINGKEYRVRTSKYDIRLTHRTFCDMLGLLLVENATQKEKAIGLITIYFIDKPIAEVEVYEIALDICLDFLVKVYDTPEIFLYPYL